MPGIRRCPLRHSQQLVPRCHDLFALRKYVLAVVRSIPARCSVELAAVDDEPGSIVYLYRFRRSVSASPFRAAVT